MFPDIFNDDAFSLVALTAFINNEDYVPGRAGELAFNGVGQGVPVDQVALEWIATELGLIQTTPRDAPAPQEKEDKASTRALRIPQIKLEKTINASSLLNGRVPGSAAQLRTAQYVIQNQIRKMNQRHDLTLEHLRLTALEGVIRDADGTPLLDLFAFFGAQVPTPVDFSDTFDTVDKDERIEKFITQCHALKRRITRTAKIPNSSSIRIHAFAGDNFFDRLVEVTRKQHDGWAAAANREGPNYAYGTYEFGGILWENYQGTDDNATVAIPENTVRFFPVGVPGLYAEYYAPGDFLDVAGLEIGVPRYARIAPDSKFNRQVFLHTQQNPIPICTRPQTLIAGSYTPGTPTDPTDPGTETES